MDHLLDHTEMFQDDVPDLTMEIAHERILTIQNGRLDLRDLGLTELPSLPPTLKWLDCSQNQLTKLPPLPPTLQRLECSENLLMELPPLPPTLRWLDYFPNDFPRHILSSHMNPFHIHGINQAMQTWREQQADEQKARCMDRCLHCKEELMIRTWHPSRIEKLLELGYDIEEM